MLNGETSGSTRDPHGAALSAAAAPAVQLPR